MHVVDGSDEDPMGQIDAVREVFGEIDAVKVPELIVVNKADIADPVTLAQLLQRERNAIVVSAKTGEGIDNLMLAIEQHLPGPTVDVRALLPYTEGALVSRIMRDGIVVERDHRDDGTYMHAKVDAELAADLEPYVLRPSV